MSRAYPRKAEIARAVQAAKACGLDVEAIEISPEGTIRVLGPHPLPANETEFDAWEKAGKL
jgi:hypothetical protein